MTVAIVFRKIRGTLTQVFADKFGNARGHAVGNVTGMASRDSSGKV